VSAAQKRDYGLWSIPENLGNVGCNPCVFLTAREKQMKISFIAGTVLMALSQMTVIQPAQALSDKIRDEIQALSSVPLITSTVTPNGTAQIPTNTFTIAHPSAGRYIITFAQFVFGNSLPAACIVMPIGPFTVVDIDESGNACDFTIADLSGNPTDTFFNFMASPITGTPGTR
jgi:hypothetical protein